MSENIVHNLYKFIKEGVTNDQMFEATKEAYKDVEEGKLPKNLNNIEDPAKEIQELKEDELKKAVIPAKEEPKAEAKGDAAPAPETANPENTEIQKDMDKATPDVEKLSDVEKQAAGTTGTKEEKKEEVKVTDVDKVKEASMADMKAAEFELKKIKDKDKEKKADEGKVPANPGNVEKSDQYIKDLTEEIEKVIADGITEESVARDLATKNNAEAVQNPDTKLWKVVSKATESSNYAPATTPATEAKKTCKCGGKNCECVKEEKVEEKVPCVKAEEPKEKEAVKVKEDVDVTIKTDDKEVNIVSADGSTQITTLDVGTAAPIVPVEEIPAEVGPAAAKELPSDDVFTEEEDELSDEDALEMAERLMVAEHLSKMDEKKMSDKQKKFIEDMKAKKFSKKNKDKIEKKAKEIK